MVEHATFKTEFGLLKIEVENNAVVTMRIDNSVPVAAPQSPFMKEVFLQLEDYFLGKRRDFNFPIRMEGTPFQQAVWRELMKIPYGETISYQELAKRVGKEKASRAVGNANGRNPICIVVPCHRVVRANGDLGGYAYGVEMKKKLISIEEIDN